MTTTRKSTKTTYPKRDGNVTRFRAMGSRIEITYTPGPKVGQWTRTTLWLDDADPMLGGHAAGTRFVQIEEGDYGDGTIKHISTEIIKP